MELRDILRIIALGERVAIKQGYSVRVEGVESLLAYYSNTPAIKVEEIEPNGYTDAAGISYLTFVIYNANEEKK
jgi:hypothetical protein